MTYLHKPLQAPARMCSAHAHASVSLVNGNLRVKVVMLAPLPPVAWKWAVRLRSYETWTQDLEAFSFWKVVCWKR